MVDNGRSDKATNKTLGSLAERLRDTRERRGLSQRKLASLAHTTQQQIQQIERGKTPRPRNIAVIAKVLDVSPAWLQFGDEELDKLDRAAIELALAAMEMNEEERELWAEHFRRIAERRDASSDK